LNVKAGQQKEKIHCELYAPVLCVIYSEGWKPGSRKRHNWSSQQ